MRSIATTGKDLVQHVVKRLVTYAEKPKRSEDDAAVNQTKEAWQYRWFGMMPVTMKVWKSRIKQRGQVEEGRDDEPMQSQSLSESE